MQAIGYGQSLYAVLRLWQCNASNGSASETETAEGNEKWGVEVGIADKKWGSNSACGPRTRKSGGQLIP